MTSPIVITRHQLASVAFGAIGVIATLLLSWTLWAQRHDAQESRAADEAQLARQAELTAQQEVMTAQQAALTECIQRLATTIELRENLGSQAQWETPAEWDAAWQQIVAANPLPQC
jgi:hypothetical protein